VSKATGGRGRAVERAHFCVNVTLRARSGERARATPLFRSRPNLFRSFHPSLRQEIFFSPFGTVECIHRSESVWAGATLFTRCRLPIQEDPLGIPLRAPQATYTKRDARYYGHSGISDLSCESSVHLSYPFISVRQWSLQGHYTKTPLWAHSSGWQTAGRNEHVDTMNPGSSRVTYVHGRADVNTEGRHLLATERFRLTNPSTRRSTLLSGKRHKPYRLFDKTSPSYSLVSDVLLLFSVFHASKNRISLFGSVKTSF